MQRAVGYLVVVRVEGLSATSAGLPGKLLTRMVPKGDDALPCLKEEGYAVHLAFSRTQDANERSP
jgi:hypothetical protein